MSVPKEIKEILEDILYWETCPKRYKKTIVEYLRIEWIKEYD